MCICIRTTFTLSVSYKYCILIYMYPFIHSFISAKKIQGIVLHLKSLSSNLKEEVQRYEIKVETLNAEGEKVYCMYVCVDHFDAYYISTTTYMLHTYIHTYIHIYLYIFI